MASSTISDTLQGRGRLGRCTLFLRERIQASEEVQSNLVNDCWTQFENRQGREKYLQEQQRYQDSNIDWIDQWIE